MISKNQALENAINIVYQTLFNLSRDEMLAIARQHPHYGTGACFAYSRTDEAFEDEAMRDCLSEEALGALCEAEGELTKRYMHFKLVSSVSLDTTLNSFNRDIRDICEKAKAKHGEFPIWNEVNKP